MFRKPKPKPNPLPRVLASVVGAPFALAGGWIIYSSIAVNHHLPLPKAVDAEQQSFTGVLTGRVNTYVDSTGSGRPLVLLHSINAAASAYEMRPLFLHYRGTRPVYAPDLPGFGFSDRSDRMYSYDLYKTAIIELLERVGEPADVVALSLTGEFAARAALERPDLFNSLTMISPSGFTDREHKRNSQRANETGSSDRVLSVFQFPLWSQAFYDLLTTPFSIHSFLQASFEGEVDPGLEQYGYITGHRAGAKHAPLYFISGKLFTRTILEDIYQKLTLPVLVLYDRDPYVRFDRLPELERRENWHAARITPTRGLPHFEELEKTVAALELFWNRAS